jgi:acetylornithine deacetylase/succinyl-diaminopimelate desuccinylase-like protein
MDPVELLEELVRVDSVNPAMGGPGEHEILARLVELLRDLGLEVSTPEVGDGRRNLIATLPGTSSAPTLLLEAHLDTVAMPEEGLAVSRTEDRLVARGSCDTKGSGAAMVAAMAELMGAGEERATVVFADVVDEEDRMLGSRALVDQLPPVDAAVIGEPTSLEPVRVHNGLARIIIETHGRAAHTSRAHLGVNAISAAARVVASLEEHLLPRLKARAHPLAGPALLTPAVIGGGVAPTSSRTAAGSRWTGAWPRARTRTRHSPRSTSCWRGFASAGTGLPASRRGCCWRRWRRRPTILSCGWRRSRSRRCWGGR